jgi:hypothetical protein
MSLPVHTARLVERTLTVYCSRFCPPGRRQLRLGFELGSAGVVIHELRDRCGVPGMPRPVPVARFRYRAASADWRLDYARDESLRWRPYPLGGAGSFTALLRAFDEDALGLFWGRVNGASLRWCSPRGRCAGCSERQLAALGWQAPAGGARVLPLRS